MSYSQHHKNPCKSASSAFQKVDWGLIPYSTAYEKQKELFEQALHAKLTGQNVDNTLIFCEHNHVITVGKNGKLNNLL